MHLWDIIKEGKCLFLFFLVFSLCSTAYGILVPQPGIEPIPPAMEVYSPNHWIAREFYGGKCLDLQTHTHIICILI